MSQFSDATVRAITELVEAHPKPDGARFVYGTAGFRMKAEDLEPVMARMGILAALLSIIRNQVRVP